MFKLNSTFKKIVLGIKHGRLAHSFAYAYAYNRLAHSLAPMQINKVLIVSKLSRYEFERRKHKNMTDTQLETELKTRGTDFDSLLRHHNLHKKFETRVVRTFREMGIEVEVVNRFTYNEEKAEWADIVVPAGGDGTFLLAASRIHNNNKPVIGFNSDPNRSEGHLCLPKKYSTHIAEAIERLQTGDFEWLQRSRIRIKMLNHKGDIVPGYLHELDAECNTINPIMEPIQTSNGNILPVLALNEVFVGETLSARVSHLKMRLNGSEDETNMKCSGVCICTGTGSTSWNMSINRLNTESVAELLRLVDINAPEGKDSLAAHLADVYNKNLVFAAEDGHMCYTVRDLISAGVWPHPKGIKSRGFATKIEMKSNCYDASLVVDGGVSFPFNDGTVVSFEIKPEDSLRTVVLK